MNTKRPNAKRLNPRQLNPRQLNPNESGQATAEYALVMLVAAAVAGIALAWAVGGGGIERLLDAVVDSIISEATG